MHGLDRVVTTALFDDYYPTLNPFLFLRDLFGLVVLVGLGIALSRRVLLKAPRPKNTAMDYYAIVVLTVIMISGFLLEGTKILSHGRYQEMAEEYAGLWEEEREERRALQAYWVQDFGVLSPDVKGPFDERVLAQGR
jgi:hypothetical protein